MERSGQDLTERSVSSELIVASLLVDPRRKDQPASHELTEDLTGLDRLPAKEAPPVIEPLSERAAEPFDVEIAQPTRPVDDGELFGEPQRWRGRERPRLPRGSDRPPRTWTPDPYLRG